MTDPEKHKHERVYSFENAQNMPPMPELLVDLSGWEEVWNKGSKGNSLQELFPTVFGT